MNQRPRNKKIKKSIGLDLSLKSSKDLLTREHQVSDEPEFVRAILESEDISEKAHQKTSTFHLLLSIFTYTNRAEQVLRERGLDEDILLKISK